MNPTEHHRLPAVRQQTEPRRLNAHQVVAFNLRRARLAAGWTQAELAARLACLLGYDMKQAGISAIERTYDGKRPRNIDIGEVVAFAVCFAAPVTWLLTPPPGCTVVPLGSVLGDGPGDAQRELRDARVLVDDLRATIDAALAATGEAR